ncbi:MAG: hypothetical protein ACI9UU_002883 [Candidatus Azotimanducaceae bacterium]
MGVPGDAEFQHRVLSAALQLLPSTESRLFVEHTEDAPEIDENEASWVCPVSFAPSPANSESPVDKVLEEMKLLRPWYDKALQTKATSVGVSGLELEDAVEFVAGFLGSEQNAKNSDGAADLLKYAVEDIKAFYNEAAVSQPGKATVLELEDWYWGETQAGKLVRAVKQASLEHSDKAIRLAAGFLLVPGSQAYRDSA